MIAELEIKAILILWILSHALADMGMSRGKGKPFNCQLCTAGWVSIGGIIVRFVIAYALGGTTLEFVLQPLVWWAVSVWIEALYTRLSTIIIK